jgi:hypothetical protein
VDGQGYLPGGGMQTFFLLDRKAVSTVHNQIMDLTAARKHVVKTGKPVTWIDPVSGMHFDIKPTHWVDANGIWGYAN